MKKKESLFVYRARKTQFLYGLLNGDLKPSLAAVPVLEGESLFYLIITLFSTFNGHTQIPMADLLFVMLK